MMLPAQPMPRPTAQVEPFVDALGPELAVLFILTFGGSEVHLAPDPSGRGKVAALIGVEKTKALADQAHRLPRCVPLANRWLARMLYWQGHSKAEIARKLRISNVTVRAYLAETDQRGGQ